jgi:hypothetical protein
MNNIIKKLSSLNYNYYDDGRNNKLITELNKIGFKKVGEGRGRIVFLSPNKKYVLKFPLNETGIEDNKIEAIIYSRFKKNKKEYIEDFAPCRLINNIVLMMKAIVEDYGFGKICNVDDYSNKFPDWVFNYDCNQCGLLSNGKLVVYDYAE